MHKLRYLDHVIQASQNADIDPEDFLEAQMHFAAKCAREKVNLDDEDERLRRVTSLLETAAAYGEFLLPMPVTEEPMSEPEAEKALGEVFDSPAQEEQPQQGFGRKMWDEMVHKFKGAPE